MFITVVLDTEYEIQYLVIDDVRAAAIHIALA